MPKALIEAMKRGGVRNPYALLNAAGYRESDSETETRKKLAAHTKARRWMRRRSGGRQS